MGLPDMDGIRVLVCLKGEADTSPIPVMIYSGRTDHDERIECFRLGADDYLEKPFDIDMVFRRVEHHLFKTSEAPRESGIIPLGPVELARRAK